jgi:hypothetical protein
LGRDEHPAYVCATPQPSSSDQHSLSSPTLSTTDPSSIKHHESSSSAYNTAESLPSSQYSDGIHSLERVLNAASTMYTTKANLQHTIQLQEELFRQRLRLRGIALHDDDQTSEHFYDNIDSETSDIEDRHASICQHRTVVVPWTKKKQQRLMTCEKNDGQQMKSKGHRVRFTDQYYSVGKRKQTKISSSSSSSTKINLFKSPHSTKKLLSSKLLTVTMT